MELIEVESRQDLARDPESGAIINTNKSAYKAAVNAARKRKEEAKKIESLETDINNIKQDLNDIKNLLGQLLER